MLLLLLLLVGSSDIPLALPYYCTNSVGNTTFFAQWEEGRETEDEKRDAGQTEFISFRILTAYLLPTL